jgi:hypothetical protein
MFSFQSLVPLSPSFLLMTLPEMEFCAGILVSCSEISSRFHLKNTTYEAPHCLFFSVLLSLHPSLKIKGKAISVTGHGGL